MGQAVLREKFRASMCFQKIIKTKSKLTKHLIQEVRKITQKLSNANEETVNQQVQGLSFLVPRTRLFGPTLPLKTTENKDSFNTPT